MDSFLHVIQGDSVGFEKKLVASLLWHCLTCVEPPSELFKLKWWMIFGDVSTGFHRLYCFYLRMRVARALSTWTAELSPLGSVLSKDFKQDLLISCGGRWPNVFLGRGTVCNLMRLCFSGLSPFYHSVFRSCAFLKLAHVSELTSLNWWLKEPLVYSGRFDVSCDALPGPMGAMRCSGITTLQKLLEVAHAKWCSDPELRERRTP